MEQLFPSNCECPLSRAEPGHSAGANPFISASTCFYDLGARHGPPPVGVVGRMLRDLNGPGRTPCVALPPSSHQVYRVPWRRNGGGDMVEYV